MNTAPTPWNPREDASGDPRQHAPATLRNRDVILQALREVLPPSGLVLEVASGSGEHALHFARALPGLRFQPSDPSEAARRSIDAWNAGEALPNLLPSLLLDASAPAWPLEAADAVLCCNMTHIAPWDATLGLLRGAAALLPEGGPLVLYGPYRRRGRALEPSNAAFDRSLRERDPRWGLRELDAVAEAGRAAGLELGAVREMPANNLVAVFRRLSRR